MIFFVLLALCVGQTLQSQMWIPAPENCNSLPTIKNVMLVPLCPLPAAQECVSALGNSMKVSSACNVPADPPPTPGLISASVKSGVSCSALAWSQTVEVQPNMCISMSFLLSILPGGPQRVRSLFSRQIPDLPGSIRVRCVSANVIAVDLFSDTACATLTTTENSPDTVCSPEPTSAGNFSQTFITCSPSAGTSSNSGTSTNSGTSSNSGTGSSTSVTSQTTSASPIEERSTAFYAAVAFGILAVLGGIGVGIFFLIKRRRANANASSMPAQTGLESTVDGEADLFDDDAF